MIIPETPIEWLRAWAEAGILPHTEYIKEVERRRAELKEKPVTAMPSERGQDADRLL